MLCPIKVNSKTIELTVHAFCYCVLALLCVKRMHLCLLQRHLTIRSGLLYDVLQMVNCCWPLAAIKIRHFRLISQCKH